MILSAGDQLLVRARRARAVRPEVTTTQRLKLVSTIALATEHELDGLAEADRCSPSPSTGYAPTEGLDPRTRGSGEPTAKIRYIADVAGAWRPREALHPNHRTMRPLSMCPERRYVHRHGIPLTRNTDLLLSTGAKSVGRRVRIRACRELRRPPSPAPARALVSHSRAEASGT
ncbi:hypothetical protein [Streptomyces chattanoogensis]|uniref:hypothetical protein n=1 Tax=Streptomyces chattanoogensis TaxID=66876 RepID=UPI003680243F